MKNARGGLLRRAVVGALLLWLTASASRGHFQGPRDSALDACRAADAPIAICLEEAIETEEIRIREIRKRLAAEIPEEESVALDASSSRFVGFLADECGEGFTGLGRLEPANAGSLCRLEYLIARRHLLESLAGTDVDVGRVVIEVEPADRSPDPPETEDDVEVHEPPIEPSVVEPSPEPAPPAPTIDSPVRAMSAETETSRQPESIEMTAPMVLEVDVPVFETLRRGYGWPTSETARFVTEGVRVNRIVVEKRDRRGAIEVLVTPVVYSDRYLHRARVEVELLTPEGHPVATADTGWIQVGRGVPAQRGGGLEKQLRFELTPDQYQQLVTPDDPPRLRMTVDVGGE